MNPNNYNVTNGQYASNSNEIINAIHGMGNQLCGISNQLNYRIDDVCKRIENSGRNRRKALLSRRLATIHGGDIEVILYFDDGTQTACPFIINARGSWKIYRIQIENTQSDKFFMIIFGNADFTVAGELSKVKASYLYLYIGFSSRQA